MARLAVARPISRFFVILGTVAVFAGLAWLVFGVGSRRGGQQLLPERDAAGEVRAGGARVEWLEASPESTFDAVRAQPDAAWQPWSGPGYIRAGHGKIAWVRVTVRNPGTEPQRGVLADTSYFSDRAEAWWQDRPGAGAWLHAVSGAAVPGGEKPLWGRTAAFPLTVPAGGERTVILRVSDHYLAHLQPAWWPQESDYFATLVRGMFAECICYGVLLALVLYNLVLWARLRFADMGFYVLSAGASTALNIIGNGGLALAGIGLGSPFQEMILAAVFGLSAFGMLGFARVFLRTAQVMPRADRGLRVWGWVLIAALAGVLAMPWAETPGWFGVLTLLAVANDGACMVAAVVAWRRGATHARFFVLAYAVLILAAGPALFSVITGNVVRGTALGLLMGRTLEMLLLSFALADRFARTQQQLVEETEQRRLIEATYSDELEIEVRERTRELAEANADKDRMLAVIGHDLRGPLTGLMRAADEAEGEFARDTAKTGRGLLLLIEDLVLWARLRAGTRVMAEHPARALMNPALLLHRTLAAQTGASLRVDVPESLHVQTDLVLAQTLVRNLLANALKFARTRIVLRAVAETGGVRFTVSNDGPPLPLEISARFAAGKDEPLTATGGLGLRLCREICRALGTKLEAVSSPETGTEFGFVLRRLRSGEENL